MSDQVVELLREAYIDEMETVMNYQTNAIVLDGVRAEEIKENLQQDIQEELTHAEQLGQRLKQLGARPPASGEFTAQQESLQPPADSTNVLAVIDGVIDAEEDAIDTYSTLIHAAEAADDPVTEDLAVTILSDEEAHRTEFHGFKRSTGRIENRQEAGGVSADGGRVRSTRRTRFVDAASGGDTS